MQRLFINCYPVLYFVLESAKCFEWYLNGKKAPHMNTPIGPRNMGNTQFYGNQWDELDCETHRYVWTAAEFVNALKDLGFETTHSSWDAKFH